MAEVEEDDLAPFQIRRCWEKRSACGKICRSCANQGNVISNLSYLYLHNDLIACSAAYLLCPSVYRFKLCLTHSLRKISKFFQLSLINFVFVSLRLYLFLSQPLLPTPLHPFSSLCPRS